MFGDSGNSGQGMGRMEYSGSAVGSSVGAAEDDELAGVVADGAGVEEDEVDEDDGSGAEDDGAVGAVGSVLGRAGRTGVGSSLPR